MTEHRPLRVGFVAEPYETEEASGMGYSVMETMKAFAKNAGPYTLTIYSGVPIDRTRVPGDYINTIVPKSFIGKFFYFWRMKPEVDVLFFIVALLPLWVPKNIQTVLICKELANQHVKAGSFREGVKVFIRDRVLLPRTMRQGSKVLVSSRATQEDVEKYYHVASEKIEIIFEGYQDWRQYKDVAPAIDAQMQPYFLFAGKVKTRKNVHGIVEAFIDFKKRAHTDIKLVIAGSYGGEYYQKMHQALVVAGQRDNVFFLGYVDAPMMYSLYTHALAYVFPSFSEGFGMPLVECMNLGVPVITSNISSMAEIVGDAGLLIDPHNISTLSAAMERMSIDEQLRIELVQKGYERAKLFSWEKVSEKYVTLLRTLSRHV